MKALLSFRFLVNGVGVLPLVLMTLITVMQTILKADVVV